MDIKLPSLELPNLSFHLMCCPHFPSVFWWVFGLVALQTCRQAAGLTLRFQRHNWELQCRYWQGGGVIFEMVSFVQVSLTHDE